MKRLFQSLLKSKRTTLQLFTIGLAASAAFLAGSVQAATTTTVINLGTPPSYTAFTRSGSPYTQIPTGTLPPGSILRSVSWNVSLWQGDPYLGDLAVYIAEGPGINPVLQVGGVGACIDDGPEPYTAPIQLSWDAGCDYAWGSTASTTLTAADGVPAIDLNAYTVFLENSYGSGGWAGTITLTYDKSALNVTVTTPPNPYGYVTGTDITATAAVDKGAPPYTVRFYTNNGAGNTIFAQAGQVTASSPPYQVNLGTLPNGVYNIYATVADGASGNAVSTTNTFYAGVVFSADTSWTTTVSGVWWDYPNWDPGYPASSDTTVINFTGPGTYTSTHNMGDGFLLNRVNFNNPVLTIAGNSLVFTNNGATLPQINQNSASAVEVDNNVVLGTNTTVAGNGNGAISFRGVISGAGTLIKTNPGVLRFYGANTYTGGTWIQAGTVWVNGAGLGTIGLSGYQNVTIESGATLQGDKSNMAGTLTMNGGRWWEGNGYGGSWTGPIHLAYDSFFGRSGCYGQALNGEISGPGGFTYNGDTGNGSVLRLSVSNSYAGPTIVTDGTLRCDNPDALGNGGALSIADGGAKVQLDYTGDHLVASLTLGGVLQPPGTYGSSISPANPPDDIHFIGTGTVTVVPAVPLIITAIIVSPAGIGFVDVDITFNTVKDFCYKLQYTELLPVTVDLPWIDVGGASKALGASMTLQNIGVATGPSSQRFYRVVQVTPCP